MHTFCVWYMAGHRCTTYTRLLVASADKPQQKFWSYTENQG